MKVFRELESIVPLMFTMPQNSFIREKQEKYDSATLLLYRLLEMIEQRRLALYDIDVSRANFLEIKYPQGRFSGLEGKTKEQCLEWYTREISAMKQKIFGKSSGKYMPEQISLLDGYIHLAVLQDEIMTEEGGMAKKENRSMSIEEKLAECCGIMNGWAQYYPDVWKQRLPETIYEYVTMVHLALRRKQEERLEELFECRKNYQNIHKDILMYLCSVWEKMGRTMQVLFEYEQYFQIDEADAEKLKEAGMKKENIEELIRLYGLLIVNEESTYYSDLMQIYADFGCYNKAEKLLKYQKKQALMYSGEKSEMTEECPVREELGNKEKVTLTKEQMEQYMELFVGREDVFAQASVLEHGKRYYEMVKKPLLIQEIRAHLEGEKTIASYVKRSNQTVKYMIFDVDLSKKVLLKYPKGTAEFGEYMEKAKRISMKLRKKMEHLGICAWVEYSGFRGYHVWVFLEEWMSCRYVWQLQELVSEGKMEEDVHIELFPNKAKLREGQAGQAIKLPMGRHDVSGEITCFLDRNGNKIEEPGKMLSEAYENRLSLEMLKRILAQAGWRKEDAAHHRRIEEADIIELGKLPEKVELILKKCGLMRHLCMKAKSTGYLTHGERLSILYVFGHIGEQGKEFVHTVMEFTLNYQYAVTEKFILRCPKKPVSCVKLREQYKMLTAEIGCNCSFRGVKDCYPSPVLHVLKDQKEVPEDVTLPAARSVSKEKEKEIYGQINIHSKTEELALKLIEMKKQKRGVDRVIRRYEEELSDIFDRAGIDCVELEIGVLLRRRKEDGYEWVIEL